MKQKLLSSAFLMAVALMAAPSAFGRADLNWQNVGSIICPPEIAPTIDASNVANFGQIVINYTNAPPELPSQGAVAPFETYDTLTYTNSFGAFLACNSGFRFQFNPQTGTPRPASRFFNQGTINCGTLDMTNLNYLTVRGASIYTNLQPATFEVVATNIINPGVVNMGPNSLLSFAGDIVDLTRSVVLVQDAGSNQTFGASSFAGGIFDGYWGVGTNIFNPATNLLGPVPKTFSHGVTNRGYGVFNQVLTASNAPIYFQQDINFGGSNIFNRIIYMVNTNNAFPVQVVFPTTFGPSDFTDPDTHPDMVIQWSAPATNEVGVVVTNYTYVVDTFSFQPTPQITLWPPLPAGSGQTFVPQNFLPFNPFFGFFFNFNLTAYAFFTVQAPIDFGPASIPLPPGGLPSGLFFNIPTLANYSAYEGLFSPGSVIISDVAGRSITNLPGRVQLVANKQLDLTRAQISSVNTLTLRATNNFIGSSGARLAAPYVDINLRATNGMMAITNLIEPTLPFPVGTIDLCSIRFTNLLGLGGGIFQTNGYHVLFVNAQAAPHSSPLIQNLFLASTNAATHDDSIIINDFLNVTTNMLLDTRRLTIATNDMFAQTPVGGLNLVGVNILFSSATPRLQYLTNYGVLNAMNAVFFGGTRTTPYYGTNFQEPYYFFVNRGAVTNFSSQIWATNFQNSGVFLASSGSIRLQQTRSATLNNGGAFLAPGNLISIEGASLLVSNHTLFAGGALTLSLTNSLDDGSLTNSVDTVTNKNVWNAGNGFSLPILPTKSSLLATTITNTAGPNVNALNQWAGKDYGVWPSGFVNNGAVGQLILNGKNGNSLFSFLRTGLTNAIYVDLLELAGATTNADGLGNFSGVFIETNFTVYYGDAVVGGHSIAEKLNGKYGSSGTNGGRFMWVSNYNTGFFSSTNITYTDGSVHRLNRALVYSCDINSNGQPYPPTGGANATCDGSVLKPDPIPVLTPATLILTAKYTNSPTKRILLTWNTIALSSNYLYAASSPLATGTNWQLISNFLSPDVPFGQVTVADAIKTNAPRYYRVSAQSP